MCISISILSRLTGSVISQIITAQFETRVGFLLELWMSQMNAESELVSSYSLSPLLTLPDLAIFSVNKCQYLYLVYLKLTITTAVR